jgi:H+/gluconate symporter-like permease
MGLGRYKPPPGTWSTLPWPVWLALAVVAVGLPLITGSYVSAAIVAALLVSVAVLRQRMRRQPPGAS